MQEQSRQSQYQRVKYIKDNKIYIFNTNDHPNYEEDFGLVSCYQIEKDLRVDFSKTIKIYSKDLVTLDEDEY
jgi:hypothetical protein